MPALVVRDGPLAGRRFVVEREVLLGRQDADVTIEDPRISRRHAVVRVRSGALEIEDLGSLNGTWVNGARLTGTRRLASGDVVALGDTTMLVEAGAGRESGTVLAGGTRVAPALRRGADAGGEPAALAEDELRPVTALFADIVGSTGLGERLRPDEVKALVGECVTRMARAVEQFGGTVQAYMGDGIAAFFGLPTAHEDDVERAARAALRIVDVVGEYAAEVEAAWGISDFNARVGINTGEAGVGLVGSSDPQAVSLGDTTNVAARLQTLAEPGTIAVGEATARSLVHRFALEPLGEVSVKGRVKPVEIWRLVCAGAATRPAARTPLVGRQAELDRLRMVLDELTAGRGQVALVLGDAGIGKTRLLGELRELGAERVTWLEGQCRSYGTELLYGPFVEMARRWIGVEEGEPELSVRAKLRAKLALLPAAALDAVLPAFARLLSLRPAPDDPLAALPPAQLAAALRSAFATWVATLARQGPVVVAVDDLHWADPPTLELAGELLALSDTEPVLFVGTSRIDPASDGWKLRVRVLSEFSHRAVELQLAPLPDDAARELLAALPRSAELTPDELETVVRGAEGNPLYLEELLEAVAEAPRADPEEPSPLTAVARPAVLTPTLESLLLARADRLSPPARRLARVAAVIGRSFPLRVLEHVAGGDGLDRGLAELLRAGIVRELSRYPETEYVFRHGLLREALLSTLPPARRRELYTTVGTACETLFSASLDERLELLAHYFSRSDDPARALDYLERSGLRAAELGADERAAQYWRRALVVAERQGDDAAVDRLVGRLAAVEGRR